MAASDWATALGAAMQQFGSSYGRYAEQEHDRARQKALLDQALARDAFELRKYEDELSRQKKLDERQQMMDERGALEQFRESAPFEAVLSPEMEGRFQKAGMGDWIGQRPATQTNIPSQFLMEGGEAQTAQPGSFLRPSLQQQAAQQQMAAQNPAIRQQQQLDEERRQQATWERRNAIENQQRVAAAAADRANALRIAQTRVSGQDNISPSVLAQVKGQYMMNPELGPDAWARDFPNADAQMQPAPTTQGETIDALKLLKAGTSPQAILQGIEENRGVYEAQGVDTNQVIRNVLKALGMSPMGQFAR